jgi:VWFA-related protein
MAIFARSRRPSGRVVARSVLMAALLGFFNTLTAAPRPDVLRTVYFSAVDANGAHVTDLTAADLTVKEGGKERPVAAVQPATAPMDVVLLVDDGGLGAFRAGVAQFLQKMLGRGQFAISVLNPQPIKVTNFTADVEVLRAALDRMAPRGRVQPDNEQIVEAVGDAAKELQKRKTARRAIVVLTVGGEKPSSDLADDAVNALKSSGASLNVVHVSGFDLGKVLGDGPRQSGGLIQHTTGTGPIAPLITTIADNLLHQYVLTYNIPDGVKLNEKFSLSTSRKGVTLIAPSRLPDK